MSSVDRIPITENLFSHSISSVTPSLINEQQHIRAVDRQKLHSKFSIVLQCYIAEPFPRKVISLQESTDCGNIHISTGSLFDVTLCLHAPIETSVLAPTWSGSSTLYPGIA